MKSSRAELSAAGSVKLSKVRTYHVFYSVERLLSKQALLEASLLVLDLQNRSVLLLQQQGMEL